MVCAEDSAVKGNPADEVVLYGWPTLHDTVSSLSPYVGKVEAFMRMNDIPYSISLIKGGLGGSPKGTVSSLQCNELELGNGADAV